MMVKGVPLRRMVSPITSKPSPQSSLRPAATTSTLALALRTSWSSTATPSPTPQLRIANEAGEIPYTLVCQLKCLLMAWPEPRKTGEIFVASGICSAIASISSQVSDGSEPAPPRVPPRMDDPELMMSRLLPIEVKVCSTRLRAPSPMASMLITAATPMITPSVVKKERTLLRVRAVSATRMVSMGRIIRKTYAKAEEDRKSASGSSVCQIIEFRRHHRGVRRVLLVEAQETVAHPQNA